jgi:hypothetical protein
MAGAIGFYGGIDSKFDIGAQLGRLEVNAETLTSHLRVHRHRVASILGTAAPNLIGGNARHDIGIGPSAGPCDGFWNCSAGISRPGKWSLMFDKGNTTPDG